MITAKEARKLAGPTLDEKIEAIGERIRELAGENKRQLRVGYDYKQDTDLWIDGGYSNSKDWLYATDKLKALGFDVSFYYSESQFVDMYTLIKW